MRSSTVFDILVPIRVIQSNIGCFRMLGYGVGHFYNDLCASMWFTYLMIFLERVMYFKASAAGFLMLVGQITDAISTPIVGMASDSSKLPVCLKRLGRRVSWHLIGTVCVTLSFPFIFNKGLLNSKINKLWQIGWYVPFIMLFQFGWASVQISHLALIPELSEDSSRRSSLGSLRYNFTVLANLFVFLGLSALLNRDDSGGGITAADSTHFSIASIGVVVIGLITSILFYATTKEPTDGRRLSRLNSASTSPELAKMSWTNWFSHLQFYKVSFLYMFSRLFINVSQVYFPFYITLTASFSKKYIAVLPMISCISSFLVASLVSAPRINRLLGNKILYLFGCLFGISNCAAMYFNQTMVSIICISILIGVAQTVVLVSVLAITADLINRNTESGAFVYGVMSFMDKLANGITYQLIELLNPHLYIGLRLPSESVSANCAVFYRCVMSFVPGACIGLAFLVLITLSRETVGARTCRVRTEPGEIHI
ncbi:unnamed protein product [Enterobius vermicularis]|uniref:Major facilitator superfamily domain-containing protein 12 n=1 Tax=Enterobius vermicularis TaxID=51028 RepID=A0A0N4V4Y0_ENTVE|nr:unnamed protein product [Enterobius vermicularis]